MKSSTTAAEQRRAKTREAAEQGEASAQYRHGMMYACGDGVPRDPAEAYKWFRAAAGQGHTQAQCQLGWMYDVGNGVPRDQVEAAKWYHRAAEQGDARAQYHLGVVYANGNGVSQDYAEAYKWFSLADADDTRDRLDLIRKKTTPTQVTEGKKRAAEFRPRKAGESAPPPQAAPENRPEPLAPSPNRRSASARKPSPAIPDRTLAVSSPREKPKEPTPAAKVDRQARGRRGGRRGRT